MIKWTLFLGWQDGSIHTNQYIIYLMVSRIEKQKLHNQLNRSSKDLCWSSTSLYGKSPTETRTRSATSQHSKPTSDNPIVSIRPTGENEEYFLEMNNEIGVSTLYIPLLKQFLKSSTELRKEGKLLTLLADDMVLDLKVPQDFIKKLFDLINTFSKVT